VRNFGEPGPSISLQNRNLDSWVPALARELGRDDNYGTRTTQQARAWRPARGTRVAKRKIKLMFLPEQRGARL
jgi:hypothetical protein